MTRPSHLEQSTHGALRVATWSGVTCAIFSVVAMLRYLKGQLLVSAVGAGVVVVFAVIAIESVRQIVALEEARVSTRRGGAYMLVGGALAAAVTVLGHVGVIPNVDAYVYLGLAAWSASVFAASRIVERRHQVRLYYAVEGLVVQYR